MADDGKDAEPQRRVDRAYIDRSLEILDTVCFIYLTSPTNDNARTLATTVLIRSLLPLEYAYWGAVQSAIRTAASIREAQGNKIGDLAQAEFLARTHVFFAVLAEATGTEMDEVYEIIDDPTRGTIANALRDQPGLTPGIGPKELAGVTHHPLTSEQMRELLE